MTTVNTFRPFAPIQFAHKIREVAANSWWVYRHEIGQDGFLKPMPRVVFFGMSKADVDQWVARQQQSEELFLLSES